MGNLEKEIKDVVTGLFSSVEKYKNLTEEEMYKAMEKDIEKDIEKIMGKRK